jgi:hypothetical protein
MTHRYWILGVLAVLAGGFTARPAAATDQDTFNRLIAKVAPTFTAAPGQRFKPTVACACVGSGPATAGFVVTDGSGNIVCGIPQFDASGTVLGYTFCINFVAL